MNLLTPGLLICLTLSSIAGHFLSVGEAFFSLSLQRYTVQIQAVPSLELAQKKVTWLKSNGASAYILKSVVSSKGTYYRIRLGEFATWAEAEEYGKTLRAKGIADDFFIAVFEPPQEELNLSPAAPIDTGTTTSLPRSETAVSGSRQSPANNVPRATTKSTPKRSSATTKQKTSDTTTVNPDSSVANSRGYIYITGPRGGCYYINRNGNKTYVDRSLCVSLQGYSDSTSRSQSRYITGPRGGCYYINRNGNKTYVDRSLCQ